MELTTGAILRHITHTDLSIAAHKLATLILDGIAWKDGYNGLPRGTAAFALSDLAERMGVSRQYLHILLAELAVSRLGLSRRRGRGRIAPWHFRFAGCEEPCSDAGVSATGDNSLYIEDSNKTIFSGTIRVDRFDPGMTARWLSMIGRAKTTLPCRAADNRHIWERFREFNQQRGQAAVPAGYLLGFMRKWRTAALTSTPTVEGGAVISSKKRELQSLIAKAPFENRHFHERDLKLAIGESLYVSRLAELQARFGCSAFQARLALHGRAVAAGVIGR